MDNIKELIENIEDDYIRTEELTKEDKLQVECEEFIAYISNDKKTDYCLQPYEVA